MSRASCLALVGALTQIPLPEDTLARYYDEALIELGDQAFLFEATLLPLTLGQTVFTLPDFAVRLLEVFYDNRNLDLASTQDMQSLSASWRDVQSQEPCTYVSEHETERTYRLFPQPGIPSKDFAFFSGAPLGVDFPSYSVMTFHTTHPQDAPDFFDLLLAHKILAREFARDSQHQDIEYARRSELLYTILLTMLKVNHQ